MVKTRSSAKVNGSTSSRNRQDKKVTELHKRLKETEDLRQKSQKTQQKSHTQYIPSSRTNSNQPSSGNSSASGSGSGQSHSVTVNPVAASKDPLAAPSQRQANNMYPQQHYGQDSRVVMPVAPRQNPLYAASAAANMYGAYGAGMVAPQAPVTHFPVHPDVRFKRLPFYDIMAEIMKPSSLVPTSTQRMQEATFYFHLTPQQATDIACGKDIVGAGNRLENIVQVQLRFCLLETSCEQEDYFPPSVNVKVNNKICQLPNPIPTNKPGVEPKRPPRPVNITALVKLSPTVANTITVAWAADFSRGYVLSVFLVRKLTSNELLLRLKNKGTKNADYTRALIKEKLSEDYDCEIATTSLRVSLMCPLGKMRMMVPCRPSNCPHLQCFDASLFIQMNERKPGWMCPVCDRPAPYDCLTVDGYFQDVLSSSRLPSDCTEIQLLQDGAWSPQNTPVKATAALPQQVTLISDDLEVIPLESGSSSSNSSVDSAAKRAAVGENRKPNDVACVDLTSDSEDDLPLKRKEPKPNIGSNGAQDYSVKTMTGTTMMTNAAAGGACSSSEPVISLDSPSPPAQDPAASPPPPLPTQNENGDASAWPSNTNNFGDENAQNEQYRGERREGQTASSSDESDKSFPEVPIINQPA